MIAGFVILFEECVVVRRVVILQVDNLIFDIGDIIIAVRLRIFERNDLDIPGILDLLSGGGLLSGRLRGRFPGSRFGALGRHGRLGNEYGFTLRTYNGILAQIVKFSAALPAQTLCSKFSSRHVPDLLDREKTRPPCHASGALSKTNSTRDAIPERPAMKGRRVSPRTWRSSVTRTIACVTNRTPACTGRAKELARDESNPIHGEQE